MKNISVANLKKISHNGVLNAKSELDMVQKIRDAERVMIYNEFIDKKGQVLTGRVARKYNDTIYVNLGKTEGILSAKEQIVFIPVVYDSVFQIKAPFYC